MQWQNKNCFHKKCKWLITSEKWILSRSWRVQRSIAAPRTLGIIQGQYNYGWLVNIGFANCIIVSECTFACSEPKQWRHGWSTSRSALFHQQIRTVVFSFAALLHKHNENPPPPPPPPLPWPYKALNAYFWLFPGLAVITPAFVRVCLKSFRGTIVIIGSPQGGGKALQHLIRPLRDLIKPLRAL